MAEQVTARRSYRVLANAMHARIKQALFSVIKDLDTFDFGLLPGLLRRFLPVELHFIFRAGDAKEVDRADTNLLVGFCSCSDSTFEQSSHSLSVASGSCVSWA